MDEHQALPEAIQNAQQSLAPYVKQRQEVVQIRRVLASHLSSHVNGNVDNSLPRPLSLVDAACRVDGVSHGVTGLQKEYLRCVRANVKAQAQYAEVSRAHRPVFEEQGMAFDVASANGPSLPLESFIDLVIQRQKHETLRIIQDYLDVLAQKPAAALEHLDPQTVLRDVETLPRMPSEVLNGSISAQVSAMDDLKELIDRLEKSVLRARMLLKREQNLLAKIKTDNATATGGHGGRLEAIGFTRSTLINWIEAELSRAGESSSDSASQDPAISNKRGNHFIESELLSIHRQYVRYTKARQALVNITIGDLELPDVSPTDEQTDLPESKPPYSSNGMEIVHPYLEEMVSISCEQKAMIQQKSHLTISLSKQLKEANQGLDRLADESHMLPAHPMPAAKTRRNGLEGPISFGDEISNHEKPDSALRARSWVYAAHCASHVTKEAVSEKLVEGNTALADAQRTLSELDSLLGLDLRAGNKDSAKKSRDIWAVLDGNLGVIKGDGLE
ncbi:hypothetical protein ONS95_007669 [Cadophora gregata]|uniref:uncharacterized protein n=1 Tax=Cadophora gregata TaxID=51156 RepID=UPI0026DB732A|nr:uncharacterized protein ONS95_007669 [Cadophora gregata]KAK0118789.1 hypothetical protein ONS96_011872 [Cadophora gregata f. sp. sojae]KAK0126048.1 hypothetical protein ONS95_007669 [Cadophora gregata]